jgi:hypothetical protein
MITQHDHIDVRPINMSDHKRKYAQRKRIFFSLFACLIGILILLRFVAPSTEGHPTTALEGILFVALVAIPVSMLVVFRCPNCRKSLATSWSFRNRLKVCPECGEQLEE